VKRVSEISDEKIQNEISKGNTERGMDDFAKNIAALIESLKEAHVSESLTEDLVRMYAEQWWEHFWSMVDRFRDNGGDKR
jgi:hypothetical protein